MQAGFIGDTFSWKGTGLAEVSGGEKRRFGAKQSNESKDNQRLRGSCVLRTFIVVWGG